MTIILSEQEKIELADAQNNGYLFTNVMSDFSGRKKECPVCTKKKLKCSGPVSELFFYSIERIVVFECFKGLITDFFGSAFTYLKLVNYLYPLEGNSKKYTIEESRPPKVQPNDIHTISRKVK